MLNAHFSTTPQTLAEALAIIERLQRNPSLDMLNQAGGLTAIERLSEDSYTVVFADIDHLKALNSATGSHFQTNRYLAAGLRVRAGELAFQMFGDEFVFIIRGDALPFIARLTWQLASQPLSVGERAALAGARGCYPSEAHLSATFAAREGVEKSAILAAIEACSVEVLQKKAKRGRA